jgi:hypothetical protein
MQVQEKALIFGERIQLQVFIIALSAKKAMAFPSAEKMPKYHKSDAK